MYQTDPALQHWAPSPSPALTHSRPPRLTRGSSSSSMGAIRFAHVYQVPTHTSRPANGLQLRQRGARLLGGATAVLLLLCAVQRRCRTARRAPYAALQPWQAEQV